MGRQFIYSYQTEFPLAWLPWEPGCCHGNCTSPQAMHKAAGTRAGERAWAVGGEYSHVQEKFIPNSSFMLNLLAPNSNLKRFLCSQGRPASTSWPSLLSNRGKGNKPEQNINCVKWLWGNEEGIHDIFPCPIVKNGKTIRLAVQLRRNMSYNESKWQVKNYLSKNIKYSNLLM